MGFFFQTSLTKTKRRCHSRGQIKNQTGLFGFYAAFLCICSVSFCLQLLYAFAAHLHPWATIRFRNYSKVTPLFCYHNLRR